MRAFHASLLFVLVLAAPAYAVEIDDRDRLLVERGAECGVDPWLGLRLLHVEDLAGLDVHRGMLIAKACHESRGGAHVLGDWRELRGKRVAKAVGLLQLWPWAERTIRDRRDPIASAHVFLGAVLASVRRSRIFCPRVRDRFRLAWIRVNRGPVWRRADRRGEARCHGTDPAGMRVLRRWRR